jgi:hypothetical protein
MRAPGLQNEIGMRDEDLASIRRWRRATTETVKLLHQADLLIEERVALCRARAELFREIARAATSFVDAAAPQAPPHQDR